MPKQYKKFSPPHVPFFIEFSSPALHFRDAKIVAPYSACFTIPHMSRTSKLLHIAFIILCGLIILAFIIYALVYGLPNEWTHGSYGGGTKRGIIFSPRDFR
jgi:hypothetical protein